MVQVTVLKFAGETGLRRVGTTYMEQEAKAAKLESMGMVEFTEKEEKTVIETKEKKFHRQTKKRK